MDEYSGKRVVGGLNFVGRGSGVTSRDAYNHDDQSTQYCNRLVCSNRPRSMRTKFCTSDKGNFSNSLHSTTGKAIVGSSSKALSPVTNTRKPHCGLQKTFSHKETVAAEIINVHTEDEVSEPSSSTASDQMVLEMNDADSGILKDVETFEEVGSYNLASSRRTQKQNQKRSSLGNPETSLPSSSPFSFVPRSINHVAKSASHGQCSNSSRSSTSNASRYAFRNLRCTSISDVLPQGCSSSDRSYSKKAEGMKRGNPDGNCSSSRGKFFTESSSAGNSGSRRNSICNTSLSERPSSQPASRRTKYWSSSRKDVISVRTRRPNGETQSEVLDSNDNSDSVVESLIQIPQGHQTTSSVSESSPSGSPQQSASGHPTSGNQNSSVRLGSRNENVRNRPIPHPEDGSARLFNSLSISRDGFRRFNIDGIAEILVALERIEQEEELTYEQLLVLETNLFLGGLGLHDQHRDMRLDIDSMSYEDLLALGEKMGTVSTALTEDQLSNCLQRSCYMHVASNIARIGSGDDDIKCSICQEEYVEGDEMGKLTCDHRYHLACIHQWLQLKNWCPICKANAAEAAAP